MAANPLIMGREDEFQEKTPLPRLRDVPVVFRQPVRALPRLVGQTNGGGQTLCFQLRM